MTQPFSLATRTFLLTFLAICAAQVAGFIALNAALKARIKEGLKQYLRLTEQQLDQQEAENNRRATELIATLSENAGLKAAIGLSREQFNRALRIQVRATIEDQLRDLSQGLDFDLFMVIDTEGLLVARVGAPVDEDQVRQVLLGGSSGPWLIRAGRNLYEVTSVPINLGTANIGRLAVGRRFDLNTPSAYGYTVLMDRNGIVASTLPAAANEEAAHQLSAQCGKHESGCEISAGGQDYLALGMHRDWVTPDYQLLWLASIDDAMRGFTQGLRRVFIVTGVLGVLIAVLFSLLASRSISRPLASLASDLESSGETGELWSEFRVDSSTREVNLLAGALNRAAGTRRQVEGALRNAKEAAEAATNQAKLTEKHLAELEGRYRGLLEAAPDAMVVVNNAGEIVLLNVQAEKQFGYSRHELVGKSVRSVIPEGFAERLVADGLRSVEDALAQQIGTGIELTGRRKDGSDFPIEIMLSPLENAGEILVTAAVRDISVRKRAEAEHTRLLTAIEQAAESVVVTNAEGGIEYVNPAFSQMTGYSREEVLGKNPRVLKSGKHDAAFYAGLWTAILAGHVWRGEMINRRKDGSLYTEMMSITPVRNEQGKMTHFVAMKEDITARKLLEDQFRQAQKMEAVGRLAAGVAHDFNNLLTIIIGYSDVMLGGFLSDDPLRTYTAEIKGAGERAAGLTRQLLAFSRQQVLAPQILDVNTLIGNITKMMNRLLGEDIDLVFNPDSRPATIKADPGLMEQVLMNLAVNARDAMPTGGKLTIETSHVELDEAYSTSHFSIHAGPYVMLAVSDTGCGMDKETQTHIFEPFFTTKEVGKGTGLGLATVYGIVKQSEGDIGVYSALGAGTTFKVYLPAVKGAREVAAEKKVAAGGSETVLLVEDDASLRGLARMVLEARGGYRVFESSGGKEARVFAEEHKGTIDLLLTDVVMPGMSGRELSEELATLRPDMRILYMSGYTNDTVLRHGVREEGMAFLQKPFTAETLLRKVREVLDNRPQS